MRTCEECGVPLHRRVPGESPRQFERRRFCGPRCAGAANGRARKVRAKRRQCTADGCERDAVGRGLCPSHYMKQRRAAQAAGQQPDLVVVPGERRLPPVGCVFCEAVRILAARGADLAGMAAAMGKSPAWIEEHTKTCNNNARRSA